MPRATNKQQLLDLGAKEFEQLLNYATTIHKTNLTDEPIFDNRTPKDILAHLVAWHKLMDSWYVQGMAGKAVAIPAPGYTFKDVPRLNEALYQEYKDISWDDVLKLLNNSHKTMLKYISNHTDEELFTKKKYKWTGSTSVGSYFASATSSHYVWANDILKKFLKGTGKV